MHKVSTKRGIKRKYTCGNLSFGSTATDFGMRNWYSHFVKLHLSLLAFTRELENRGLNND